jgi:hypothetical protein
MTYSIRVHSRMPPRKAIIPFTTGVIKKPKYEHASITGRKTITGVTGWM